MGEIIEEICNSCLLDFKSLECQGGIVTLCRDIGALPQASCASADIVEIKKDMIQLCLTADLQILNEVELIFNPSLVFLAIVALYLIHQLSACIVDKIIVNKNLKLSSEKKSKCIVYSTEIILSSIVLPIGMVMLNWEILFQPDSIYELANIAEEMRRIMKVVILWSVLIALQYFAELVFIQNINFWLKVHHIMTITIVSIISLAIAGTNDQLPVNKVYLGAAMLLYSYTEQSVFILMLFYRLEVKVESYWYTVLAYLYGLSRVLVSILVWFTLAYMVDDIISNPSSGQNHFWDLTVVISASVITLVLMYAQHNTFIVAYGLAKKIKNAKITATKSQVRTTTKGVAFVNSSINPADIERPKLLRSSSVGEVLYFY